MPGGGGKGKKSDGGALMRAIAIIGIILLLAGVIALAYGGFPYKERQTEVQIGPLTVTAEERRTFPISPLAGAVMVAGGLVLLILGLEGRRRSPGAA